MNQDIRSFIGEARQLGPDYYAGVSRVLSPLFEPCVIQQKLAAEGRYPVIRCNSIEGSEIPLVTNLFGSYELLGLALGVDPGEPKSAILQRFLEREQNPLPTKTISSKDAPVKQRISLGEEINLGELPIVHHAEKDSGKYITVGVLVLRDPDTGVLNAGMYRHEVKGKTQLACMFNPAHHGGYIYRRYKELNKRMEAVLFIGHHPAALIGSLCEGPMDISELEVMGGLLGEALEVVGAETVDIPVPAFAEIAIEGYLDPANETGDGPFAEFTGYYGPSKDPVGLMNITAVTMREDAIYHDLDPAHQEHNLAGALTLESTVYENVRHLVPTVTGIYLPVSGSCRFTVYISIKKRVPGEGKSAGLAALSANNNIKIAIVVDDDIDIYDEQRVLWAIATTFEADRDLSIISNMMGSHLNPAAYGEVRTDPGPMNTKVIIDATRPATLHFEEPIKPPEEAWNRIRLEEYLD
ncbi:MAG: UbiD family decarboxylase [Pseudomonadota bacterium]|nr:UbiD family decarboxylase [Pseudomonadota bacterium]